MIFFCLGFPGPFAEWCDRVIGRLADPAGGAIVLTWPPYDERMLGLEPPPSALDEIALCLIKDAPAHIVFAARLPDERLYEVLAAGVRFVIALDDPRLAVPHLLARAGGSADTATRAVANDCPLMLQFTALPGALILNADRARLDPTAAVRAMADHLGLSVSDEEVVSLVEQIGADAAAAVTAGESPPAPPLTEAEQRMIDGALGGYDECFARGGGPGQIIWRRDLFPLFDDGSQRATGLINVAGPPRCLLFGPYLHVPPGRWTARAVLGFSPEAAGSVFMVDACADQTRLGEATIAPVRGGVYAADIAFSIDRPSRSGLEIRVLVTNHNARGQMALGHVLLQPLAMRAPEAMSDSEDFASVLDL